MEAFLSFSCTHPLLPSGLASLRGQQRLLPRRPGRGRLSRLYCPSRSRRPRHASITASASTAPASVPPGDGASADTGDLFLIDAMNLIHPCYHVREESRMSAGDIDTCTVFSVTLSLLMPLQNYVRGARMVVVFEGSAKERFRTQLFPDYKAQRTLTPDAFKDAVPLVRGVVEALGCRCVEVAGVEADDVIGTLASRWQGRSVVVSNDKNFRQLVGRNGVGGGMVEILRPMRGGGYQYFDENTFEEEFDGMRPQNFIDHLALTGDASDNISGVPGVGPVTVLKAFV